LRLDSHQHFTAEYTPDLLFPILKRNRFEGSVVVCGSGDTAYHFQLAAAHHFIRGVVAWADLSHPKIGSLLDEYQRHPKFRGVTGSTDTASTDTSSIGCGLAELEARHLTFDLQDLALVPEVARRHPRLRIVIDHLGRPPADPARQPFDVWALALECAAQHPLVFGKLSGLITHCPTRWTAGDFRPYVQHALRTFGPHRLMFGSDWPSYLPEGTFKESLAAFTQSIGALPIEMREQLLGGTAERAYAL
jgi:L-fuconolactonase